MAKIFIAEFNPTKDISNSIFRDGSGKYHVIENKTINGKIEVRTVQTRLTANEIVCYLANAANRYI